MPEAYALSRVRWQFFITLTFPDDTLPQPNREKLAGALLGKLCRKEPKTRFKKLLWCRRWELGSKTLRGHYHITVAGLHSSKVTVATCEQIRNLWFNLIGGIATAEIYNDALGGVAYILKLPYDPSGKGDYQEVWNKKEAEHLQPTLSASLLRLRW
ncbi:MAG: hypothetical protein EOP84_02420 [Verrucomicrobiaceae bacterium]|nr:MAG: hypothetical protein EOP84_02420 [Verrucomicrobiaceae bacterium]